MKQCIEIIIVIFAIITYSQAQPVDEGLYCQSNGDCKTSCCYNLKCRSKNTCSVYELIKQKEQVQSCVIDDQCSGEKGCCINKKCVENSECFRVYTLPLLIGFSGGVIIFLIIFGVIYIHTEMKKPKNIFRQEAEAEDKLIKKQFPRPLDRKNALEQSDQKQLNDQDDKSLDISQLDDNKNKTELIGFENSQEIDVQVSPKGKKGKKSKKKNDNLDDYLGNPNSTKNKKSSNVFHADNHSNDGENQKQKKNKKGNHKKAASKDKSKQDDFDSFRGQNQDFIDDPHAFIPIDKDREDAKENKIIEAQPDANPPDNNQNNNNDALQVKNDSVKSRSFNEAQGYKDVFL
ncbi:UNKNOWN [Stylonychia lemnae]|uniref:Transmembrane protein n=1 Tax=Stylonychia lemnae TaxID=5949 RepID=A0A078A229_STYLE|nr:UNKNOWN [Stylonychia lemnae]|eukprot:CDW75553.1 UNKNOWN [Stylonychia lemnae]